MKLVIVCFST
ncbi:hypothetical protein DMN91_007951 [Ooceraea biroi]|uniref:Uncharacterized protein n=1 Tax=Ooceraea biroi TaxID=2015173 RepID=A0A3L8DG58_OOCBI|nr:hypothetical protein DMN91_007951 [Ooceraea biroi]